MMEVDHLLLWFERIIHFEVSALLAAIAASFICIHRCRGYFSRIRQDFVCFQRQQSDAKQIRNKKKKVNKESSSNNRPDDNDVFVIGFFHPYCSAGGGGERVLWKAIQAFGELKEGKLMDRRSDKSKKAASTTASLVTNNNTHDICLTNCKNLMVVIYTVDEPSATYERDLLKHVQERFSITIPKSLSLHFVHLHEKKHLLRKSKRRLTLMVESLGTMKLSWCALSSVTPHVFFDTTGCAFTFFVARILAGCKVGTYVHYPTISTDMLSLVWKRRPTYNNDIQIATNPIVTCAKLIYYLIFAFLYGLVGSLANLVFVNSSWTKNHIQYLWKLSGKVHVVFPPVDTKTLKLLSLADRENMIMSIGQFRPEKDHSLQLVSFAKLLGKDEMRNSNVKLVLVGSCRGEDDRQLVDQLQKLARELNIQDKVEFVLNQPYSVLKEYLSRASIGVHTMWNEHFGIGVVEMMAAGLVTIAHDSGGPKSDIIQSPWNEKKFDCNHCDGYLASNAEQYSTLMYEILKDGSSSDMVMKIRENGRRQAELFSDEIFLNAFKEAILSSPLFLK
jgi:alpha-1,2-mannosyltransferase